jgi:hypothetical protein
MSNTRIALYIGNELYPGTDAHPAQTIKTLQASPLTSPILSLLNENANNPAQLVYNDGGNPVFDTSGAYIGSSDWPGIVQSLRSGGNIQEVYLSFSTNGSEWLSKLISKNSTAAHQILRYIRNTLGFDGIDLDYEGSDFSSSSPIYSVAKAAIGVGLKVTAAPFFGKEDWNDWVQTVQKQGGTVAWLNLQCYAGGKSNNPGDWLSLGVPIVAGSCNKCGGPPTTCSPSDMQSLFTLWRTGQGSVTTACWTGTPNTQPQAIGGGFIWVYSSVAGPQFPDFMNALKSGLGM